MEDREELEHIVAEFEGALGPAKRRTRAAELVLLRKIKEYAQAYRYHFPPKMQDAIRALAHRSHLELLSAEQRAELEEIHGGKS